MSVVPAAVSVGNEVEDDIDGVEEEDIDVDDDGDEVFVVSFFFFLFLSFVLRIENGIGFEFNLN